MSSDGRRRTRPPSRLPLPHNNTLFPPTVGEWVGGASRRRRRRCCRMHGKWVSRRRRRGLLGWKRPKNNGGGRMREEGGGRRRERSSMPPKRAKKWAFSLSSLPTLLPRIPRPLDGIGGEEREATGGRREGREKKTRRASGPLPPSNRAASGGGRWRRPQENPPLYSYSSRRLRPSPTATHADPPNSGSLSSLPPSFASQTKREPRESHYYPEWRKRPFRPPHPALPPSPAYVKAPLVAGGEREERGRKEGRKKRRGK